MRYKGLLETNLPGSPEMMRGAVPVESSGGICRVAGMTPYAGLMTAACTVGVFACKIAGYIIRTWFQLHIPSTDFPCYERALI